MIADSLVMGLALLRTWCPNPVPVFLDPSPFVMERNLSDDPGRDVYLTEEETEFHQIQVNNPSQEVRKSDSQMVDISNSTQAAASPLWAGVLSESCLCHLQWVMPK